MVEHGERQDSQRAIDHVLSNTCAYSIDQYASKVLEKLLKQNDDNLTDRYRKAACTKSSSRPRLPLIDSMTVNFCKLILVASDQYGNYLIVVLLLIGLILAIYSDTFTSKAS